MAISNSDTIHFGSSARGFSKNSFKMKTLCSLLLATLIGASVIDVSSAGSVEYGDLGVFEYKLLTKHYRKPSPPEEIDTVFRFYSKNVATFQVLDRHDSKTIMNSDFQPTRDTKVLIHGWTDNGQGDSWLEMKDTYLQDFDVNVIIVDWHEGADQYYPKSRADIRVVGREIASLITLLNEVTGAGFESFHIIGHSLGAHTAGYAGEDLRKKGKYLGRITGLDPAGVQFRGGSDVPAKYRLDKTDALFVDVMHTDGGLLGLGLLDQLGHQDFYPNNGQKMPGCHLLNVACDHSRAVEFFIESISPNNHFRSTKAALSWEDQLSCNDYQYCSQVPCPEMGNKATPYFGEGVYYLETNPKFPYCQAY